MVKSILTGFVAVACAQVAAGSSLVGGAFVTDASWNAAASATLGQPVTVYRLFFAYNQPSSHLVQVLYANFEAAGRTLYQEPISNSAVPVSDGLISVLPELAWDSFVSIGSLRQPSTTAVSNNFRFTQGGVTGDTEGQSAGGAVWQTTFPPAREGESRAPGAADANGDPIIPSYFDAAYSYVFAGQFTLLGEFNPATYTPVFDAGYIYSNVFEGYLGMTYNNASGVTTQVQGIAVIPAPGGASALVLTMGALGARRRR